MTPPETPASPVSAEPADYLECSDVDLVRMLALGQGRALEALFLRFGTPAYSLACRILVDRNLAHDVVQECFLALWRAPEKYNPSRGAFSSWFMSMVHHKAVDAVRREEGLRRRRTTADDLADRESLLKTDDAAMNSVRGEHVRQAIAGLPDAQREALVLAYWGGFTQREIAGLTSTPLGTVKTRMALGMKQLRRRLDEWTDTSAETDSRGEATA